MTWGKGLIIAFGLMLLTHVAHAREIERFTDSQGTLHITNLGPKKPGSPVNSPSPAASFRPGNSPENAPVAPAALELTPRPKPQRPWPRRRRPDRFRPNPDPVPGSAMQPVQAG